MRGFLVFVMFFCLSCSSNQEFEDCLINENNESFWVLKSLDDNGNYTYVNSQFVFFENGKSIAFNSFNEDKKGTQSMLNIEGASFNNWRYNSVDSVFQICSECVYKVQFYSNDSIRMTNKFNGEKFLLVKKVQNINN